MPTEFTAEQIESIRRFDAARRIWWAWQKENETRCPIPARSGFGMDPEETCQAWIAGRSDIGPAR